MNFSGGGRRKTRTRPPAAGGSATQMKAMMNEEAGGTSQNAGRPGDVFTYTAAVGCSGDLTGAVSIQHVVNIVFQICEKQSSVDSGEFSEEFSLSVKRKF